MFSRTNAERTVEKLELSSGVTKARLEQVDRGVEGLYFRERLDQVDHGVEGLYFSEYDGVSRGMWSRVHETYK